MFIYECDCKQGRQQEYVRSREYQVYRTYRGFCNRNERSYMDRSLMVESTIFDGKPEPLGISDS